MGSAPLYSLLASTGLTQLHATLSSTLSLATSTSASRRSGHGLLLKRTRTATCPRMCASLGMYPAEIQSPREAVEQGKIHRFGDMFIGAHRSGSDFVWTRSGETINTTLRGFELYATTHPSSNGANLCLVQTASLDWRDDSCNAILTSVGCEKDSTPMWGASLILQSSILHA